MPGQSQRRDELAGHRPPRPGRPAVPRADNSARPAGTHQAAALRKTAHRRSSPTRAGRRAERCRRPSRARRRGSPCSPGPNRYFAAWPKVAALADDRSPAPGPCRGRRDRRPPGGRLSSSLAVIRCHAPQLTAAGNGRSRRPGRVFIERQPYPHVAPTTITGLARPTYPARRCHLGQRPQRIRKVSPGSERSSEK